MPQLDLIIETHVRRPARDLAPLVDAEDFGARLWREWPTAPVQRRGLEGVRWESRDERLPGSCELWIEAVRSDACVLHAFVRLDRRGRPWPSWRLRMLRRRLRIRLARRLWALRDHVESGGSERRG